MLTFATNKLSTAANGQKEDAASFVCLRSFDQDVMACTDGPGTQNGPEGRYAPTAGGGRSKP